MNSASNFSNNEISVCRVTDHAGVAFFDINSKFYSLKNTYTDNFAAGGGVFYFRDSFIQSERDDFIRNSATLYSGVFDMFDSDDQISKFHLSTFIDNNSSSGGVCTILTSEVLFAESSFQSNNNILFGTIVVIASNLTIFRSTFLDNSVSNGNGPVLYGSKLDNNGVLFATSDSSAFELELNIYVDESQFINNTGIYYAISIVFILFMIEENILI